MTNATVNADGGEGNRTPPRGLSVRTALLIALGGAVCTTLATVTVLRSDHSVGVDALLGGVALVAIGVTAYGFLQAVLALIDTAGERRRHERDVTERRKGARARPKKD